MINAGFEVFSRNSYRKSPMQEIADRAGISKSLLFHYFHNKKELYLFLWDEACRITMEYLERYGCYEPVELFEMMEKGMRAKIMVMKRYPNMTTFVVKAFYETDPAVSREIQESYRQKFDGKALNALSRLDPGDFVEGLDLAMMYREMYLASAGYVWEVFQQGGVFDAEKLERDFSEMVEFWKAIYLRKK